MADSAPDHYQTLGVDRHASAAEIKGQYRRLALRYHPDRNPGDRAAEDRFKELSRAYAVLADPDRRQHYDRFGAATSESPFGFGDANTATEFFDTILGDLFGLDRKRRAGQDLRYTLELSFEEAALGCERTIEFDRSLDCGTCAGTGAQGGVAGLMPCAACDGKGRRKQKTGFFSTQRECMTCAGSGEVPRHRCKACLGSALQEKKRQYTVRVPPGSVGGSAQRIAGEGTPGRRGGPAGDLHVLVRVRPHAIYRVEDGLLTCETPITYDQAVLGADLEVPVLDGGIRMKIPAGTQSGAVFRVKGKGMPHVGGPRGDLHVRVQVEVPLKISSEAETQLRAFSASVGDENHPRRKHFRDAMIKKARGEPANEVTATEADGHAGTD